MQRKIGFTISDLEGDRRGTPALDYLKSKLISFWNAELYLVEENEIIDGKKSPIYRPVTLGKLIRLACILTVGWLRPIMALIFLETRRSTSHPTVRMQARRISLPMVTGR